MHACMQKEKKCVYTVYVKTGEIEKSGTNSKINLTFSDSFGKSISIGNLREWGLMGERYDYFERGNLDIFSGRSYCISPPICKLTLTSDGKGILPAWYVETIEVTFSGFNQQCSQAVFCVDRWLAPEPHSQLSFELDVCATTPFPSWPWPWSGSMRSQENGRIKLRSMANP